MALLSHAHLQSVFIIGAIVRRQQELLGVRHPTLLLRVTWVGECLDYLLRTIYLEGCCKAVLGAPSLDRYFRQPVLTNDFCDSPTYCGHCSTLLWKRDPQLCDTWWGPSGRAQRSRCTVYASDILPNFTHVCALHAECELKCKYRAHRKIVAAQFTSPQLLEED